MNITLFDEQGVELTAITSRDGRVPGEWIVDQATRPDALFQYYFGRGGRTVTLAHDAERYPALLGTRWQMGARCWFLQPCSLVRPAPFAGSAPQAVPQFGAQPHQSMVERGAASQGIQE